MKKIIILLLCLLISGCEKTTNQDSSIYYQIFVGSFSDSDGDGIGDINGIIDKLDYLETLNIKGIWLTPIHPSNSYHKYDVIDYYNIDEDFGSISDFEKLINECKKRNIEVIMDLVINHTSNLHPLFIEASASNSNDNCTNNPICDYYVFTNEVNDINTKIKDGLYYDSSFGGHMPDLNLENQDVIDEIENICAYWLEKGVSAFRLDAVIHYLKSNTLNIEFINKLDKIIKKYNQNAYLIGEAWTSDGIILDLYQSDIYSLFNFGASGTNGKIVDSIRRNNGQYLSYYLSDYQNSIKEINDKAINSVFVSNHDQARSRAYFYTQKEKYNLMINTLLLAPGNVFLYYGEELGMLGSGIDENKRLAMPWGDSYQANDPINADYKNIEETYLIQKKDKESIYNHYLKLIKIRSKYPELKEAKISNIKSEDNGLYAMLHELNEKKVIVLHNYSDVYLEYSLDYKVIDYDIIDYKESSSIEEVIKIAPYASIILEVE